MFETVSERSPGIGRLSTATKVKIGVSGVLCGFALMAYTHHRASAIRTPERSTVASLFVDDSPSTTIKVNNTGQSVQSLGLGFFCDAIDTALPVSDVHVFAFSQPSEVRSIWTGRPLGSEDMEPVNKWLAANPQKGSGTFAEPAFRKALAEARSAASAHCDIVLVLVTDSEINDTAKLAPIVAELAKLPNIKAVVVCPVTIQGQYRSEIESVLAPLGKSRVIVASAIDLDQASTRLRGLLNH